MSRSFAARLDRIEARVSWRVTVWKKQSGEEWRVESGAMFDAWFRTLLGKPLDLDPDLSRFIATSIAPRGNEGEMVIGVYLACREVWFPRSALPTIEERAVKERASAARWHQKQQEGAAQ